MKWVMPLLLSSVLLGQEANPNRPTFSSPATTTAESTVEVELGVQQIRQTLQTFSQPLLVKYGLSESLELRLGSSGTYRTEGHWSSSDSTVGAQYNLGAFGLQYTHKFPTGKSGTLKSDDTVNLIFSQDWDKLHMDLNALRTRLGGYGVQTAKAASFSFAITNRLGIGSEVYQISRTELNPSVVSNLYSITYRASKTLVIDGGIDVGLSKGSQKYSLMLGFTKNLGRLL